MVRSYRLFFPLSHQSPFPPICSVQSIWSRPTVPHAETSSKQAPSTERRMKAWCSRRNGATTPRPAKRYQSVRFAPHLSMAPTYRNSSLHASPPDCSPHQRRRYLLQPRSLQCYRMPP